MIVRLVLAAFAGLVLLFGTVLGGVALTASQGAQAGIAMVASAEQASALVSTQQACASDGTGETLAANALRAAGFPDTPSVEEPQMSTLDLAVAVSGQESRGWDPMAGNQLADGRTHRGLMQISSLHLDDPAINVEGGDRRYEPDVNARMAYRLWVRNDRKFHPTWSGYTDGGWRKYAIRAVAAVDGTTVNQCAVQAVASGKGSAAGNLNGRLDEAQLCPMVYAPGQRLRCDAQTAFAQLTVAYAQAFGTPVCVTDSYRDYAGQVAVRAAKPGLAAVPGTSNHGWAIAVDLCGGIQNFGTPQYEWMLANAPRFGWVAPTWARIVGSKPEPWHWEFGDLSGR